MKWAVDTNVLLRGVQPNHPLRAESVTAVRRLLAAGDELFILPQIVAEFWNVCTRPEDKNGLGFSVARTEEEVQRMESVLVILTDAEAVYQTWRRLVVAHAICGVQVHDARIVAALNAHGVSRLMTYNVRDFKRYSGIVAMTPADILREETRGEGEKR
jgi:predicted nucleic acid-binding protein